MTTVMDRVRDRVADTPEGGFIHTRELVADNVGSRAAVDVALHRLKDTEPLLPVRRGMYYKGRRSRFGVSAPDPLDAALEVARVSGFPDGVGPAGYTASRVFGLTTQVPSVSEVSVPGRAPAPTDWIKFVSRSPAARRGLRPIEVAVLELLTYWPRYTEEDWSVFVARVAERALAGDVDVAAVRAAASRQRHVHARVMADKLVLDVATA